jgi:hypothetical protein
LIKYLSGLIPQERGFLWSIHDVVYGNEEKDRKPILAFVNEVNKYPGLLNIIESIVCGAVIKLLITTDFLLAKVPVVMVVTVVSTSEKISTSAIEAIG